MCALTKLVVVAAQFSEKRGRLFTCQNVNVGSHVEMLALLSVLWGWGM